MENSCKGNAVQVRVLRQYAIDKIRSVAKANNTNKVSKKMVLEASCMLTEDYLNEEFGSVKNAIRAAKLYPVLPDPIDLVRSMIEFKNTYGRSPRMADADSELLPYSAMAYLRVFRTWNNALAAAGLEANRLASGGKNRAVLYGEYEIQIMLMALQMAYGETGILPPRRVHDSSNPAFTARQYRRIGNWGEVAKAANLRLEHISAVHTKQS